MDPAVDSGKGKKKNNNNNNNNKDDPTATKNEEEDKPNTTNIADFYDKLCFLYGEQDAIVWKKSNNTNNDNNNNNNNTSPLMSICHLEIQEQSKHLAFQLWNRYRPDYVLVDCFPAVAAEAVAILACIRISVPFVPVDVLEGVSVTGLVGLPSLVQTLKTRQGQQNGGNCHSGTNRNHIVAICCAPNDSDPRLGVFYAADIYSIVYLDPWTGALKESLAVPQTLPKKDDDDELYILMTSGTWSDQPKAVIGSHKSTFHRIVTWFRNTFFSDNDGDKSSGKFFLENESQRVARKTRLTFVDGVTELLGTLLACPHQHLVAFMPEDDHVFKTSTGMKNVMDIVQVVQELQPHQLTLIPSQLNILLDTVQEKDLKCLKRLLVSGEVFSESLWSKCQTTLVRTLSCQIINLYGQTESTGDVLAAILTDLPPSQVVVRGTVAVGTPILPQIISICTTATIRQKKEEEGNNQDQAIHNDDEIWVEGNLSNGYLSTVMPVPFPTGDVGFCNEGIWYICGRFHDMQKINGIMTNPRDVEATFASVYYSTQVGACCAAIVEGVAYVVYETSNTTLDFEFSRQYMRDQHGIPWNLIPKAVLEVPQLPRQIEGAGKVSRTKVIQIIRERLVQKPMSPKSGILANPTKEIRRNLFYQCLGQVLPQLQVTDGQHNNASYSFVDLGGDSAKAVQLLALFRHCGLVSLSSGNNYDAATNVPLSALDILQSTSLIQLQQLLRLTEAVNNDVFEKGTGADPSSKRPKLEFGAFPSFRPKQRDAPSGRMDSGETGHISISFAACVDASAVTSTLGSFLYAGCQGGLVQQICTSTFQVLASWRPPLPQSIPKKRFVARIQADPICSTECLLICCHYQNASEGSTTDEPDNFSPVVVFALSHDLKKVLWSINDDDETFDLTRSVAHPGIVSTPILIKTPRCNLVWVLMNMYTVKILELATGSVLYTVSLQHQYLGKPAFHQPAADRFIVLYAGVESTLAWFELTVRPPERMDKEFGPPTLLEALYDGSSKEETTTLLGPVYKDATNVPGGFALLVDSYGSLHVVHLPSKRVVCSTHISGYPLSSPALASTTTFLQKSLDPDNPTAEAYHQVIVGSYDGTVYGYQLTTAGCEATLHKLWDYRVGGCVYARPLTFAAKGEKSNICVVVTTAGDVVHLSTNHMGDEAEHQLDMVETDRFRVYAEIWSDPVLVQQRQGKQFAVFGARDSKLHAIRLVNTQQ